MLHSSLAGNYWSFVVPGRGLLRRAAALQSARHPGDRRRVHRPRLPYLSCGVYLSSPAQYIYPVPLDRFRALQVPLGEGGAAQAGVRSVASSANSTATTTWPRATTPGPASPPTTPIASAHLQGPRQGGKDSRPAPRRARRLTDRWAAHTEPSSAACPTRSLGERSEG